MVSTCSLAKLFEKLHQGCSVPYNLASFGHVSLAFIYRFASLMMSSVKSSSPTFGGIRLLQVMFLKDSQPVNAPLDMYDTDSPIVTEVNPLQ